MSARIIDLQRIASTAVLALLNTAALGTTGPASARDTKISGETTELLGKLSVALAELSDAEPA
jgi:hypothetical protein